GEPDPTHAFRAGRHLVKVRVTDDQGFSRFGTLYVVASGVGLEVFGSDLVVDEGSDAALQGTVSDPSLVATSYWDPDYQFGAIDRDPSSQGQLTWAYEYSAPGDYTAALEVIDTDGLSHVSTMSVTVLDVAPTASITASGPTPEGSPVTF